MESSSKPGELIRKVRVKEGLTQEELAQLVGTTQSAIARFENGNSENHSLLTLKRLANALGWELVIGLEDHSNGS